jgi:hypothetical protein
MSIPKIIHLIEPSHNVLSVWQNTHPDWQCIEWTLEGCYAFLKRYYPDAEAAYLKHKTTAQRVHMSWYYLLHRYGGVVVEGNRVPKKKVESLFLSLYDLYLIEDWFIASAPQTEFLSYAIETLPTLESKWYERFLGEKALVRSSATVLPDTPYKRHPYRVYQNYFHPLHESKMSLVRIGGIIVLILCVFQLIRIVRKKKAPQMGIDVTHLYAQSEGGDETAVGGQPVYSGQHAVSGQTDIENIGEVVRGDSDVLPSLSILQNMEISSLEKNLGLRVPPIKLPRPEPAVTSVAASVTVPASVTAPITVPIPTKLPTPVSSVSVASVPSVESIRARYEMLSRLPPLNPDTPSSISSVMSDQSLVITPFHK